MSVESFSDDPELTIQQRYLQFRERNPVVEEILVRLAREAMSAGHHKFGIEEPWNVMRWELRLRRDVKEAYKLNNDYKSRYARDLMVEYPELAGLFETRRLRKP